jgi:hypothetical protein
MRFDEYPKGKLDILKVVWVMTRAGNGMLLRLIVRQRVLAACLVFQLSAVSAKADANACESLANAIVTSVDPKDIVLPAGASAQLQVDLDIADSSQLDLWDEIIVLAAYRNGVPGSAAPSFDLYIKENGSLNGRRFAESVHFRPAMRGIYNLELRVFAFSDSQEACARSLKAPAAAVTVVNDEARADVLPPKLRAASLDQASYLPGQQVTLSFFADEKSPICDRIRAQAKECEAVDHVEFKSTDGAPSIDIYPGLESLGGGQYAASFLLPPNVPKGTYVLHVVNIYDVHGNMAALVPDAERISLVVK